DARDHRIAQEGVHAEDQRTLHQAVDEQAVRGRVDVGHAAVVPLKCSPLGVSMPSSDSSGAREAPLPVVPGCERMPVRVTLTSYFAGLPYSLIPAPGAFIDGATSGGSTASARFAPPATRPLAASRPAARLRKLRLDSSIVASRPTRPDSLRPPRARCP